MKSMTTQFLRSSDARCARVLRIVARHQRVRSADILSATRSRSSVAHARQLAMYLCHVLLHLNLTEVGRYFGRDRTTVAHACALIEDSREDWSIDCDIQGLEDAINGLMDSGAVAGQGERAHAAH